MNFDDNFIRNQKIDRRIKDIPKIYRKIYEKAVINGSKPAAIKAFCLECVCWRIEEVRMCTDLACPLHAIRPYQERSQNGRDGHSARPERMNTVGNG